MYKVQNLFKIRYMKVAFNHTFLSLIPKSNNASKVEHFRLIAL